jgi:hypothetical protein
VESLPSRFSKFNEEFEVLQGKWAELFSEENKMEMQFDLHHTPPAFKYLVDGIIDEATEVLNEELVKKAEQGWTEEQQGQFAVQVMQQVIRVSAIRCYQLAQALKDELPWEKLSPCGCVYPDDEELSDLLSAPFELEGEGWVIKGFDTRKEGRK